MSDRHSKAIRAYSYSEESREICSVPTLELVCLTSEAWEFFHERLVRQSLVEILFPSPDSNRLVAKIEVIWRGLLAMTKYTTTLMGFSTWLMGLLSVIVGKSGVKKLPLSISHVPL
ncbi:hypothetical protein CDAR_371551 [Caerostris darwini]|uniref:Uncharacterized protein n=1 Tax=Caerostris darwini TaxID=1538125 RepID=A0AAV4XBY2_9ARAC|nr:hypothetical protein CDAR_371551 [Caerostris darwini]